MEHNPSLSPTPRPRPKPINTNPFHDGSAAITGGATAPTAEALSLDPFDALESQANAMSSNVATPSHSASTAAPFHPLAGATTTGSSTGTPITMDDLDPFAPIPTSATAASTAPSSDAGTGDATNTPATGTPTTSVPPPKKVPPKTRPKTVMIPHGSNFDSSDETPKGEAKPEFKPQQIGFRLPTMTGPVVLKKKTDSTTPSAETSTPEISSTPNSASPAPLAALKPLPPKPVKTVALKKPEDNEEEKPSTTSSAATIPSDSGAKPSKPAVPPHPHPHPHPHPEPHAKPPKPEPPIKSAVATPEPSAKPAFVLPPPKPKPSVTIIEPAAKSDDDEKEKDEKSAVSKPAPPSKLKARPKSVAAIASKIAGGIPMFPVQHSEDDDDNEDVEKGVDLTTATPTAAPTLLVHVTKERVKSAKGRRPPTRASLHANAEKAVADREAELDAAPVAAPRPLSSSATSEPAITTAPASDHVKPLAAPRPKPAAVKTSAQDEPTVVAEKPKPVAEKPSKSLKEIDIAAAHAGEKAESPLSKGGKATPPARPPPPSAEPKAEKPIEKLPKIVKTVAPKDPAAFAVWSGKEMESICQAQERIEEHQTSIDAAWALFNQERRAFAEEQAAFALEKEAFELEKAEWRKEHGVLNDTIDGFVIVGEAHRQMQSLSIN